MTDKHEKPEDVHAEFHEACYHPELAALRESAEWTFRGLRKELQHVSARLAWHETYYRIDNISRGTTRGSRVLYVRLGIDADMIPFLQEGERGKEFVRSMVDRTFDTLIRAYFRGPAESEKVRCLTDVSYDASHARRPRIWTHTGLISGNA